jgi:hypothetical protein
MSRNSTQLITGLGKDPVESAVHHVIISAAANQNGPPPNLNTPFLLGVWIVAAGDRVFLQTRTFVENIQHEFPVSQPGWFV